MSNNNNNSIQLDLNNNTLIFDNKYEKILLYFGLLNFIIVLIIIIYIMIYCIIKYKNQGNPTLNIHSFAMKKILNRNRNLGPGQNYEFKSINNQSSVGDSVNQPNSMSLNEIKEKNFKDSINNIINSSNLNNSGDNNKELKKKKKAKKKKDVVNSDENFNFNNNNFNYNFNENNNNNNNNSIEIEMESEKNKNNL